MTVNIKQPLVSVIIPCFNVEAFIEKAISSLLAQTYNNVEIWIIDDASTDNTLQKIKSFKDDRIRIVELKENTGKVGGVNQVLKQVSGEFIAFQDGDDWSEPERIEQQVKEFKNDPNLGICFTNFRYTGLKTFLPGQIAITNNELRNGFLNFLNKNNESIALPVCATMMISKAALLKTYGFHPYFTGRVAEDIHWVYRILKDFKGITVNKILYNYRSREGSFMQLLYDGKNAKYAYSFQLLSKIIYKDIHEGIDVMNIKNKEILQKLELEACEEALLENIQLLNDTRIMYRNSRSFKIGYLLLSPWRLLKSFIKKQNINIKSEQSSL